MGRSGGEGRSGATRSHAQRLPRRGHGEDGEHRTFPGVSAMAHPPPAGGPSSGGHRRGLAGKIRPRRDDRVDPRVQRLPILRRIGRRVGAICRAGQHPVLVGEPQPPVGEVMDRHFRPPHRRPRPLGCDLRAQSRLHSWPGGFQCSNSRHPATRKCGNYEVRVRHWSGAG